MDVLKTTPLHSIHRAAGARMVDFGGYDMPVHYGSQIDEHHAVRRDAGMFDVSHMRAVDVEGPAGAPRDFLRYVLANNVDKLKAPGRALYSCLLEQHGFVVDDLIVYFLREDFFRLVVNAGTADKDIGWLTQQNEATGTRIALKPRPELALIAVQGPQARGKVGRATPALRSATQDLKPFTGVEVAVAGDRWFVARTGYTGEDGFELIVPAPSAEPLWTALRDAGVRPCGLGARDTLRLEAGMNLYGQDMDETVTPLESGLAWTVDLAAARDFVGKSALALQQPKRQLVGLVGIGTGGVFRAHQKVSTSNGDGEITSGTYSPTLAKSIALARVPIDVSIGATVDVCVRDKRIAARVVKPPFVRNGKSLIE
ncbi:MAG TPA: glycine cleavage system aminomethyltransferase GcvT [Casimicrobiaceae bacterium]